MKIPPTTTIIPKHNQYKTPAIDRIGRRFLYPIICVGTGVLDCPLQASSTVPYRRPRLSLIGVLDYPYTKFMSVPNCSCKIPQKKENPSEAEPRLGIFSLTDLIRRRRRRVP